MKILHTSDWHLGHSLKGFDRHFEHQCFLDWLLGKIREQDIDVLLITGDIFDSANPSAASKKQLYRFLQAAREAAPHLRVVLIAGNHESPGRLEASLPLLDLFETTVVGQTGRNADGKRFRNIA
jgi:exonuclease SbcD